MYGVIPAGRNCYRNRTPFVANISTGTLLRMAQVEYRSRLLLEIILGRCAKWARILEATENTRHPIRIEHPCRRFTLRLLDLLPHIAKQR
jgi:hypothetical protein